MTRPRTLSRINSVEEWKRELPALATLSEGQLMALAYRLAERGMTRRARFVLAYLRVSAGLGHPADPVGLWDDWQRGRAVPRELVVEVPLDL